jgi:hypothetical protein
MTRKDKSTRDDFALGLGGMRTVASFTSVAAIPARNGVYGCPDVFESLDVVTLYSEVAT